MTRTLLASLSLLALAACGGGDSAGKSTTKLDAVEVQPGSVSDSMIILDDAVSDGTAVDNSVPDDGTKKDAAKSDDADSADEAAPESEADSNPDAVDIPVARKAITADPAAKKGQ
ncbi:hypothetical protein SAMN05428974_2855 [Sphingopyxis sp. YR583]|uniref:hypothetical protein n=1 Tax=Sphingopyxis sp. YR583 TaxID=1881047 RepID=UPI0008A7C450|nr:hypothetical protein [Sphingopyxis sp. YR583]SEH18618.1 hypothetical protein SAMN05428974_2855 [Sphingopyxis sp. YR583]